MVEIVPSVKNLREGTHREFWKFLMRMGQKMNSVHLPQFEDQIGSGWTGSAESELRFEILIFRERGSDFSLRSRAIGPSDFFEPRRKVALRDEDYAWAPILRSFDKLREVGVLSFLFYPLFKCFVDGCVGLRP